MNVKQLWVGMVGFVCLSAIAYADGFRNPPEGAAALGRGGSRLTQGDDPSTVTHNPANLMDIKKSEVMPTMNIGYSKKKFTDTFGRSEESESPWTFLPAAYMSQPLENGAYVFGMGLNVPYGQASQWKENGILKGRSPYFAEMKTVNLSPALATQVTKDLNVGVGLNVMWSSLEFRQMLPWMPLPAGLQGPASRLNFEGDGYGVGPRAGMTYQLTPRQRVSLVYQSPIEVAYEGDFTMDNPLPGAAPSSDFKTEIDFPAVAGLGYGLQVNEQLRVEANVEWVEHSQNEQMNLDIGRNNPLLMAAMGTTSLPQNWDDTWTFGAGADWKLNSTWTLRGGWTYLPTPVPAETMMPSLAENDCNVFGLGVGYDKGAHRLDLAYAYNLTKDRDIASPRNPVNGSYEFDAHLFGVTYGYSF